MNKLDLMPNPEIRIFNIKDSNEQIRAGTCFLSTLMFHNKLSEARGFLIKSLNKRVFHPYIDNNAYITVFVALERLNLHPGILFKFDTAQKDQEVRACEISKLMLDRNFLVEAAAFTSSILPEKYRFQFSCELFKRQNKESIPKFPTAKKSVKRKISFPYERKFPRGDSSKEQL